jgi:hypothetical protein
MFEAASTTNLFGDTTIGTSAFGEPTGTGPAGFSFGATAGAAGFSFATKSCTNFAVTSSGTLLSTALKATFGSAVFPNLTSISSSRASRTTIYLCHTVTNQFLQQNEHHHESLPHKQEEVVAVAAVEEVAVEAQHQLHENEQQQRQQKQPNW